MSEDTQTDTQPLSTDTKIFSLIEAENDFLVNHPNFRRSRPGFHPSSASVEYMDGDYKVVRGACMRQSFYKAIKADKDGPPSVYMKMTAELGKSAEVQTSDRWKKMGLWMDNNVKFYNKPLILSGEQDFILRNPITGKYMGVEHKTFYSYGGRRLLGIKKERGSNKFLPGMPKYAHFLQAILYWFEYRDELDEYRLYCLDRGNGDRAEFWVGFEETPEGKHRCYWEQIPGGKWNAFQEGKMFQPYTVEDIHNRYRMLLEYVRTNTLPAKDYKRAYDSKDVEYLYSTADITHAKYLAWKKNSTSNSLGDWNCNYCQFSKVCKQDDLTS